MVSSPRKEAFYFIDGSPSFPVDRLPARFSGQSRSNATKVVNELIEDRESRARAFLKRADSARAEGESSCLDFASPGMRNMICN